MVSLGTFLNRRRLRESGGGALFLALAAMAAPSSAHAQTDIYGNAAGGIYQVSLTPWRDIPFRTVVRQQYDYSCGSAAVATLLRYHYGVEVSEADVFRSMYAVGDQARIREVGFSMLDMRNYLARRGFQAEGFRLTLDRIGEIGAPGIALITRDGYRHFVVVKGVEGDQVLVGDPTFGLQRIPRAEFESYWNGVLLAVRRPAEGFEEATFNDVDEWTPWTRPPMGLVPGPASPAETLRELPPLYQISPDFILNVESGS
ncbi:MAG: C39 family peptidase [Hyphomonadaceae bacterium]